MVPSISGSLDKVLRGGGVTTPHPSCSRVSKVESTVPLLNRTRSVEFSISEEDAIDLSTRISLFVMYGIM